LREASVPFGGGEDEEEEASTSKKKKKKAAPVQYPVVGVLVLQFLLCNRGEQD